MKTLRDVLPYGVDYGLTACADLLDVEVISTHDGTEAGQHWLGRHRNVYNWWTLANDKRVGWNESPSVGWTFSVLGKQRNK